MTQTQSNSEPVSDPQKLDAPQGFLKKKEHKTSWVDHAASKNKVWSGFGIMNAYVLSVAAIATSIDGP